ncbi:MAG: hypothetical protein JWN46_2744, partial [Acidimicrobiales bacterium]|nr:hypothetical protein [Acidimicrobiales bacterium]
AALPAGWRRWVAGAAVVALSLTTQITMWETSVLTESPALSLLALVVAAVLRLERGFTRGRVLGVLGATLAWAAVRDSHATVVLMAAVVVAVWFAVQRSRPWRRPAVLLLGLLAIGGAVTLSAAHGHRDAQPIEHVLAVRVLPYPERRAWFAQHGMPLAGGLGELAPIVEPGLAPYVAVPPAPEYAAWRRWIRAHGRSTLIRWTLTHPTFAWTETFRTPERVFNNGQGQLDMYLPQDFRAIPLASRPWHHATWWVVTVALGLVAVLVARGTWRSPLALTGALLVLTAAPHAAIVWHSDGMESARHLVVPGTQLRIGVVLLFAAALRPVFRAQHAAPAP